MPANDFISEELGKAEMLEIFDQMCLRMRDNLQFSKRALVEFEHDENDEVISVFIRSSTEEGFSNDACHFGNVKIIEGDKDF